jgi:hypothetical protein
VVVLSVFLFWYLGKEEDAATKASEQFITALEKNSPKRAPENGADYVRGVWKVFRRVDSAELVDTRKKSVRTGSSTSSRRSYWVADILLQTRRGPAVIELQFESNHIDPDEQVINLVYELTPERIPEDAIDDKTLARVESAQRERGAEPANDFTLSVEAEAPRTPVHVAPPGKAARAPSPADDPVLRCVKRARGDVRKLQRCAELAGG